MRIASVNGLGNVWGAFAPDVLDRRDKGTVGGGESALLQTAFGLAARGHEVTIFYQGLAAEHRGVHFRCKNASAYTGIARGDFDAVIGWSDASVLSAAPPGTKRIFSQQLNHLPISAAGWKKLDVLVSPSATHLDYLWRAFGAYISPEGIGRVRFHVVPNGVDPKVWQDAPPLAARGPIVSYWSSPDRGLHHLLLLWPRVKAAVPDAELHVFYRLRQWVKDVQDVWGHGEVCWRGRVISALLDDPPKGVYFHDALSRPELAEWQMRTKVLAYPFDPISFTEGWSVAICEGLAAGCRTLVRPDDAIEEVYGHSVEWIRAGVCTQEFRDRFADAVIEALRSTENPKAREARETVEHYTWANAARDLESTLL